MTYEEALRVAELLQTETRLILKVYRIPDPEDVRRVIELEQSDSTEEITSIFYDAQSLDLRRSALEKLLSRLNSFKEIEALIFNLMSLEGKREFRKFLNEAFKLLDKKTEQILLGLDDREVLLPMMVHVNMTTIVSSHSNSRGNMIAGRVLRKLVDISNHKDELVEVWEALRFRVPSTVLNLVRKLLPMLTTQEIEKVFKRRRLGIDDKLQTEIDRMVKKEYIARLEADLRAMELTPQDLVSSKMRSAPECIHWSELVKMACEHVLSPRET